MTSEDLVKFRDKYRLYDVTMMRSDIDSHNSVTFTLPFNECERLMADAMTGCQSQIPEIDTLAVKPDEIVVMKYSMDDIDLNTLRQLAKDIAQRMTPTPFIAIPREVDLVAQPVEVLKKIKEGVEAMIVASDYDNLVGWRDKQISSARS